MTEHDSGFTPISNRCSFLKENLSIQNQVIFDVEHGSIIDYETSYGEGQCLIVKEKTFVPQLGFDKFIWLDSL